MPLRLRCSLSLVLLPLTKRSRSAHYTIATVPQGAFLRLVTFACDSLPAQRLCISIRDVNPRLHRASPRKPYVHARCMSSADLAFDVAATKARGKTRIATDEEDLRYGRMVGATHRQASSLKAGCWSVGVTIRAYACGRFIVKIFTRGKKKNTISFLEVLRCCGVSCQVWTLLLTTSLPRRSPVAYFLTSQPSSAVNLPTGKMLTPEISA